MSNSGLGRGLDALLPEAGEDEIDGKFKKVPVDLLEPNPDQPRQHFGRQELEELVASIEEQGVIEPLLVRPLSESDQVYELVAGERRWRAAVQAGLERVPVIVRELSDQRALTLSLVENIQREDLNPIEEAEAYRRLMGEQEWGQQQLAEAVGKSRSAVANRLRLLELPEEVQEALQEGEISAGHARPLTSLDEESAVKLMEKIKSRGLSVRQVEQTVSRLKEKEEEPEEETEEEKPRPQPEFRELEAELEASIGAPVEIQTEDRKSGQILIHFNNPEEFELLRDRIKNLDLE